MSRRRLFTIPTVAVLALFGISVNAHAAMIVWDFNPSSVDGPVGAPSYSVDSVPATGILLTVAGFDISGFAMGVPVEGPAHDLWWKQQGADEHGIGLVDTLDKELTLDGTGTPANLMRIDLDNIYTNPLFSNAQIRIQSVTIDERWDLYGWDGMSYTLLETANADNNAFRPLPFWGTYRGYAVTVSANASNPLNNVLFDAIAVEREVPNGAPEPGVLALLGGGLAMLLFRRTSRSAGR